MRIKRKRKRNASSGNHFGVLLREVHSGALIYAFLFVDLHSNFINCVGQSAESQLKLKGSEAINCVFLPRLPQNCATELRGMRIAVHPLSIPCAREYYTCSAPQ
jgi:hypothetical protein